MANICDAPLESITPTQSGLDLGIDYFMLQTPSDVLDLAFSMLTASTINTCDSGIDLSCAPSQPFDTSTFMTAHID
ncbi:hypothetical protein D6C89_07590 [Aureobasidium pullulans]|nr:hypothetical protein D6C89_07590 [Aureobasidium pullulans]